MGTHGNLLVIDEGAEKGTWLHAYSDGHPKKIYKDLIELSKWVGHRIKKSYDEAQKANPNRFEIESGPGWLLEHYLEFGTVYTMFGCYASVISSLLIGRHFDLWHPMREEEAPHHNVGDPPQFTICCDGISFRIIPSDLNTFEEVEINFISEILAELEQMAKEITG